MKKQNMMNKVNLCLAALLLGTSCSVKQGNINKEPEFPTFDTEAHRGGRGLMPENTIAAMIHGIDLGVTTIEMDCHITKDNQVIVSHDDALNPAHMLKPDGSELEPKSEKQYILYQMTYAEISKYDIGTKYYDAFPEQKKQKAHIPLLSDLIDSVQAHIKVTGKKQVFYNIETKSSAKGDGKLQPEPEVFVRLLMEQIEKKGITPWVIIQSFDVRTLEVLNKKYPHVKTSYLVSKNNLESNLQKISFTPTVYSPHYKLVDADLVKQCHEKGMKIIPWTPNTKEEIDQLKAFGVDGIISDYPNLFFN